jgi:formylglycine-generating enzyme required for sulfatase activity
MRRASVRPFYILGKTMNAVLDRVKTILPQPFDWCAIPEGQVTIEGARSWDGIESYIPRGKSQDYFVPAFYLAKYPITNLQFASFVEADGYQEARFWTAAAWQYREKSQWRKPRYWDDKVFTDDNQPVVGISWHEALAFCTWLNELISQAGKPSHLISLPTEQQWQRAAQGDDRRKFPWGNDFDIDKTNVWESGISYPSYVDYYPEGQSPYGVVDMLGNVEEWCLNDWEAGSSIIDDKAKPLRVLRGGNSGFISFDIDIHVRACSEANDWSDTMGFRICAIPSA